MTAKAFEVPQKVFRIMKGANFPWFIAGGWTIDLYLFRITREYSDIEICIFRADHFALRDRFA
ncbi:hypothetical protein GF359_10425 [candidate division WOR-3 bacterium]|uniref:Uncharacterized protein n=1 Tax=candidate division WOR-3 bacterium TaxID=2052148 RepID=A0A9D5KDN8_UNCW3|nr:hypothetical protein [candidate division WOR-3 bacterium]MBD3365616.1 hypothetical protein [candidate division WOR-3 bacterium]